MALNKSAWKIVDLASINASTESALTSSSVLDLTTTVQFATSIRCDYSTNASQPARLRLYAANYNWSDVDTNPYAYFDNEISINTSRKITVPVCPDAKYIKATVENRDSKNISTVEVYVSQGIL